LAKPIEHHSRTLFLRQSEVRGVDRHELQEADAAVAGGDLTELGVGRQEDTGQVRVRSPGVR